MPDHSTVQKFEAAETQVGQTLATALRAWLPGESWGQVRKRIETRRVTVRGSLCMDEGRKLSEGEVIEVFPDSLPPPPGIPQVSICYSDLDLVVVEKPAGMVTLRHVAEQRWPYHRRMQQPSLEEAVTELLAAKEKDVPLGKIRSVHRIDKESSGLLVFARNAVAEKALIEQFTKHTVERKYLAIVKGKPTAGEFRSRLIRNRGDGLRGSSQSPGVGQAAVTHVKIVEPLGDYTLIECRLETGRTHQIRIHLTEAGYPLCGDRVYRSAFGEPGQVDESSAPRLALHAAGLGFVHPRSQQTLQYEMPLPRDLSKFLTRLQS